MLEKLGFSILQAIILHRKAGSGIGIPRPLLPCRVEQGMVLSLLPRPPQLQDKGGPVRIDQEVQKKNLPRPPLPHKKDISVSIGMDSLPEAPVTQLQRPFSGPH